MNWVHTCVQLMKIRMGLTKITDEDVSLVYFKQQLNSEIVNIYIHLDMEMMLFECCQELC